MVPPRHPDDVEASLSKAAVWIEEEEGNRVKQRVADGIFSSSKSCKGDDSSAKKTGDERLEISQVDRYQIEARIGSGAMGMVFRAYDPQLDRPIAIKLLHAEHSREETAFGRMIREARALARLSHPNVIHVYDVGMMAEQMYIAMELIEGVSLRSWLHQSFRERGEILQTMLAAGRGLAHAHRAGLVHRDFKPDNIIVGEQGRICVVDFGLARPATEAMDLIEGTPEDGDRSTSVPSLNLRLTHTGTLMGTPRYLAPEVFKGSTADALSDQFSFCVTLFEALYNRSPFSGKTVTQYAASVLKGEPVAVPIEESRAEQIHRVICRGLQLEPGNRYQDLQELLSALEAAGGDLLRASSLSASPDSGSEFGTADPNHVQEVFRSDFLSRILPGSSMAYLRWFAGTVLCGLLVWVVVEPRFADLVLGRIAEQSHLAEKNARVVSYSQAVPQSSMASPRMESPSVSPIPTVPNAVGLFAPAVENEGNKRAHQDIDQSLSNIESSRDRKSLVTPGRAEKPENGHQRKVRSNHRKSSHRESTSRHSPSTKDWCSLREDSYVLLIREKRRRARFEFEGQCYQCRVERSASRTRAFSPNNCRGYQLCWVVDNADC